MTKQQLLGALAHELPADLQKALLANVKAISAWNNISAIARNEWICWTITVKQQKTRDEHVKRTVKELAEGKKRPCCWVGCIHRTDKAPSPWAKRVLIDKEPYKK